MTESRLTSAVMTSLRNELRGEVLGPDDDGYEEARRIWNGRFDRRPSVIARCASVDDVVTAVNIARENELLLSVRSGGHDYAGNSMCDGGMVIDLSLMDGISIDAAARTARVEAGARWGAFDEKAQAVGLATTGGTVSTVGVAGFTLGGGTGYLVRKHGLGLDNLISADVVTANGEKMRASEADNSDLFWALRGGSGNLGIVTSFEFRLHPVGPEIVAGQVIHPLSAASDVLRFYRDFMSEAPDEIQCYAFFLRLPPLDFIPETFHGRVVIDLVMAYAGNVPDAEKALAPLRAFGDPILDSVSPVAYTELQRSFDAGMPYGNRWYSKSHYLRELSDDVIDELLAHVPDLPGEFTIVYLEAEGGAIGRVPRDATAFPHRDAAFALHIFPGWSSPADDAAIIDWSRKFHHDMAARATGGVYVNLLGGDEPEGARSAYGANYERLRQIKAKYDPNNLFRMNHNVKP